MRALRGLNAFITQVSAILLLLLTIVVIVQITFRYVLQLPLTPAEEIARFSMILLALIGSAVLVRHRGHIRVGYFVEKLPPKYQKVTQLLVFCLEFAFMGVLVIYGSQLASAAMAQSGAATGIPMGLIMAVIPISGAISMLYIAEQFVRTLTEPPQQDFTTASEEPLP